MALGLVADEPDRVPRLQVFRAPHQNVIIGPGGLGTWQARVPGERGGSTARTSCGGSITCDNAA
jgi:hypothetical protein